MKKCFHLKPMRIASIVGLLALLIVITACQTHNRNIQPKQESPDLLNVTLKLSDFDDYSPKLINGSFEDDHMSIRVLQTETADVNRDGLTDGVAVITVNSGGTGHFRILCLFINDGEQLVHTDDINIGDRVKVTNLSIDGETIIVDYLDRAQDDPYAEPPYIKKTVHYNVRGNQLENQPATHR